MNNKNHLKNQLETEDSNSKSQIMCQCSWCRNQHVSTMKSCMFFKSKKNDSECIPPCHFVCGQLNNAANRAKFTRKLNQIATSSPKFKTNFHNHFCDSKHIDNLDLRVILADNVARSIYYRGLQDGYNINRKNKFKSKYRESVIQKYNKPPSNLNNNADILQQNINVNAPIMQLKIKNPSQIKSIEINADKKPSNTLNNDSCLTQFSIDNIDVSHLPLPALQLMFGSELSDKNNKSNEDFNKDSTLLINKNSIKCTNDVLSTSSFSLSNKCKIHTKDSHQNKLIKTENAKRSDLPPMIPLSVLHYLDKL